MGNFADLPEVILPPGAKAWVEGVDDEAAPRSLVLGVPVTASYDASGLLTAATTPVGTIGDIQRDAQGLIESYDLNGTTYSVTRDGDGRVTEVAAS